MTEESHADRLAPEAPFKVGDVVRIVCGSNSGKVATVEEVQEYGDLWLALDDRNLAYHSSAVERVSDASKPARPFKAGDAVRIVNGTYTGHTGTVCDVPSPPTTDAVVRVVVPGVAEGRPLLYLVGELRHLQAAAPVDLQVYGTHLKYAIDALNASADNGDRYAASKLEELRALIDPDASKPENPWLRFPPGKRVRVALADPVNGGKTGYVAGVLNSTTAGVRFPDSNRPHLLYSVAVQHLEEVKP